MQVIGAGLGGTGTLQAKTALELLGFGPCYHVADVKEHPEQTSLWQALARGSDDWNALFGRYASSVDFPACVFYGELLEVYPEAKVLLTLRDPELAYERVRETIYKLTTAPGSPLPADLLQVFRDVVWDGLFGGAFEDRPRALEVYRRWDDDVRARVPADRLLAFDVREGWKPLCRFLDREVPEEPFPE